MAKIPAEVWNAIRRAVIGRKLGSGNVLDEGKIRPAYLNKSTHKMEVSNEPWHGGDDFYERSVSEARWKSLQNEKYGIHGYNIPGIKTFVEAPEAFDILNIAQPNLGKELRKLILSDPELYYGRVTTPGELPSNRNLFDTSLYRRLFGKEPWEK